MKQEPDAASAEAGKPASFAAFLSRPGPKQALSVGMAVALLVLLIFAGMALIRFLSNPRGQIGWWKFDERRPARGSGADRERWPELEGSISGR